MEIIDVIVHTYDYWVAVTLITVVSALILLTGLLILFTSIFCSKYRIEGHKHIDPDDIVMSIMIIFVGVTFGSGAFDLYNRGAAISYKATVTDINEVNENGYEIVEQEGEIYTLRKQ